MLLIIVSISTCAVLDVKSNRLLIGKTTSFTFQPFLNPFCSLSCSFILPVYFIFYVFVFSWEWDEPRCCKGGRVKSEAVAEQGRDYYNRTFL